METKLFDTHLHLADSRLFPQWEAVFHRALAAGVEKCLVIATNVDEMEKALQMKDKYKEQLYVAASITPHEAHIASEDQIKAIFAAAQEGQLDALGETGLEYHYLKETAPQQLALLERTLQVATSLHLPVVFHCRDGFNDLYPLLDTYRPRGVLHCFTGTTEEALEIVKRDLHISFSGILTYKKSGGLRETAKQIPLEKIVVETDAPYLAPESKRGKTNEPAFILDTLNVLASCLGLSAETVAKQTYRNGLEVVTKT